VITTELTSLDLDSNQIGDEGGRALAALKGLTSLDLSSNQIRVERARSGGTHGADHASTKPS
jgi:hypothetical protein